MLFGLEPQVNIKFLSDAAPAAVNRLQILNDIRKEAQIRLEALQKHKDNYKPYQLMQGDDIWLEAKNLMVKGSWKLLPKQYGPFKVLEHIGQIAYRLKLPLSMKVHDIFHIDLLTLYYEIMSYRTNYVRPPLVTEGEEEEYKIKSIWEARRQGWGWRLMPQTS